MSVAFNKSLLRSHLLLAILLLLVSFRGLAQESEPVEFDTLAQFHDSESRAETEEEWILETDDQTLQIVVLKRNLHGEPVIEPFRIVVGYQMENQDFKRLTGKGNKIADKTFCEVDQPFLSDRDQFFSEIGINPSALRPGEVFYQPGRYLIVPVHKFDEATGACQVEAQSVEAFWLNEILESQ